MINAVLGAIFGDIVGSPYEVNNTKDYNFKLFSHRSRYTDDTVLTIATADWLNNGGMLQSYYDVYGHRYYNNACGFGKGFTKWLELDEKVPYESDGNGSAMRVSPVGCFCDTVDDAVELAQKTAICTHNSPDGIEGAKFVAAAIVMIKQGMSKDEIREKLSAMFSYDLSMGYDEVKPEYGWKYGATNRGTVPYAFICFYESADFIDAIRKAVSLGGDSDTIGAICGSMAGAFYGIPDKYMKEVYSRIPKEFIEVISRFALTVKK